MTIHCTDTDPPLAGLRHSVLRKPQHPSWTALSSAVIVGALFSSVFAEELPATSKLPLATIAPLPAAAAATVAPAAVDPCITLRGSVWRTKTGIVFFKTPIGLLSLSSTTTLKDIKTSHEVRLWVHGRHTVIEIRKKIDGSLLHRYLSGPMTSGTEAPKTLRWWGPEGDLAIPVGAEDERFANYQEGDPLTVEVNATNTLLGVHDVQYDLQVNQIPPAGAEVQLFLSGTVAKLKSNFVLIRTAIGLVMLNTKIGIPPVKIGQPLIVRIGQGQVTITLPSPEAPVLQRSAAPIP